jgi:hypothetical protein
MNGSNEVDMSKDSRLSKSKILSGLQCHKRLWLEMNRRELARVSPASEHIFRMGHLFGEYARPLMGQGELIGHVQDVTRAVAETRAALERASAQGSMVYEAAFSYRNVVARADGFEPFGHGWHMTEVKAASAVKDYFYQDCAIQAWVAEGAGYPVSKVSLACIDRRFVYRGDGAYEGLLRRIDVTAEVKRRQATVDATVDDLRTMLTGTEPNIAIGSHCSSPYACPFIEHCGAHGADARRTNHRPVRNSSAGSSVALAYPRHFLRMETIATPVPLWAGTHPYQRMPVLWSCQTETQPGYLLRRAHLDAFDAPSKQHFAHTLLDALESDAGVIVATFVERESFEALRANVPELGAELGTLVQRFVYLPGVAGRNEVAATTERVDIADSESAEQLWWEASSPETGNERKQKIAESLLRLGLQYAHLQYEAFNAQNALRAVGSRSRDQP